MDIVSWLIGYKKGLSNGGQGGSVEGVHYVTFMSEDGATELYKRPVADGDDCADPVNRGLIPTPTKESTAQYDYSFVGWATTPNGAWNENALKAVTEDKTVYAAYSSALRFYFATFYDGNTVIGEPVPTAYGAKAIPPAYEKPGHTLTGWTPSDLTIYGDTSFVANWETVSGYELIGTFSFSSKTQSVAVSKDGSRMAVTFGAEDVWPSVYDLTGDTPTLIKSVDLGLGLPTLTNFDSMYYSDDGSKLYLVANTIGSSYGYYNLVTLDATNDSYTVIGTPKQLYRGSTNISGGGFAKSPTDEGYAYWVRGAYAAAIKTFSDSTIKNLSGSSGSYVYHMSYSPDGEYVAASYNDGYVRIYNASNGSIYKSINTGTSIVIASTFSEDNSKLAVYVNGGVLKVYDVASGTVLIDVKSEYPDATKIYFVDGTNDLVVVNSSTSKTTVPKVLVFDVSGNALQAIENIPTYSTKGFAVVQHNIDGRTLAFSNTTANSAEVWRKL